MNNMKLLLVGMITIMGFVNSSCSDDDESSGESLTSSTNGNKSHNAGQNCMNCHVAGGGGEGTFVVAGTVYNSTGQSVYPNAIITLTTGANGTGTLRATIYCDAKGNFYTTALVDFSGGLYPAVKNTSGAITYMQSSTTQGACNSCHGSSNRITVQ